MKHAKKHIPKIPKFPKIPSVPEIPSTGAGTKSAPPIPMGGMKGYPPAMEKIMKHITSDKGFSNVDVKRMIKDFDLDQYRDENGKITCPVPKEDRQALMDSLK